LFDGRNNIISNITKEGLSQFAIGVLVLSATNLSWEYCDVYDIEDYLYFGIAAGTGCISADPMYIDAGTDFHLQSGSPCIDTGDPGIQDENGSTSDMGAYGGQGSNW
jgi:hypothetical protein